MAARYNGRAKAIENWNRRTTACGEDVVAVPAAEWQATMDYFRSLHDCATCKHAPKCTDPDCLFAECTVAGCVCRDCLNGSKWEWRYAHGKD